MMDMAHNPVRHKTFSPFGNYWITGSAMVGVATISVLLAWAVLLQQDANTTGQDMVIPSVENLKVQEHAARPNNALIDNPIDVEKQRKEQSPIEPRFTFYDSLPKMEVVIPVKELQKSMKVTLAPVSKESANKTSSVEADTYYLQAGSFRDKKLADKIELELAWLGFKSNTQEISINDSDVYYRVSMGPFIDLDTLDKSKQRLGELGVETSTVIDKK